MAFQDWDLPQEKVFEWRKGTTLPGSVSFNVKIRDIIGEPEATGYSNLKLRVSSGANWLLTSGDYVHNGVYPISTTGMSGNMTVTLSSYINTFNPDNKTTYLSFYLTGQTAADITNNTYTVILSKLMPVRLKIYAVDQPILLPEKLTFNHHLGTSAPAYQSINVDSPNAWEIYPSGGADRYDLQSTSGTVSIVTFSAFGIPSKKIVGTGSGSFNIRPSASYANSLAVSSTPYTDLISVGYNPSWYNRSTQIEINVLPNIDIVTTPNKLDFHAIKTVYEAPIQTITVDAAYNYIITGPSWAIITPNIGTTGILSVDVSVITSDLINVGNYQDVLIFSYTNSVGVQTHTIPITYLVDGFVILPYSKTEFNFTLDNKVVSFFTNLTNTFFDVTMNIKAYEFFTGNYINYIIPFKIVLLNGRQKENIGLKIHRVMDRMKELDMTQNKMYKTCEVQLTVEEKDLTTRAVIRDFTLSNIKFIAGMSPTLSNGMGILSIYDKPSRVTSSSKQIINLLIKAGNHQISILKNNTVVTSYSVNGSDCNIYCDNIDFDTLQVNQGDVIEYRLYTSVTDFVSKKYIVFPDGKYNLRVIWEDEYKLLSSLQFTGGYVLKTDFDTKINKKIKNNVEVIESVVTNKENKPTLNTGYVLKDEQISIESLYRAKRAWLVLDSKIIEIIPVPKTITSIDSERELNAYDVEFIINRDTNEEVYTF